jgi:uncharacterized membrane protein
MKITIVKNKYLNALFILMLFTAIVHLLILAYLSIKDANIYIMNYFKILNIDSFIPNYMNSVSGNIISIVLMVVLYIAILFLNKSEHEMKEPR